MFCNMIWYDLSPSIPDKDILYEPATLVFFPLTVWNPWSLGSLGQLEALGEVGSAWRTQAWFEAGWVSCPALVRGVVTKPWSSLAIASKSWPKPKITYVFVLMVATSSKIESVSQIKNGSCLVWWLVWVFNNIWGSPVGTHASSSYPPETAWLQVTTSTTWKKCLSERPVGPKWLSGLRLPMAQDGKLQPLAPFKKHYSNWQKQNGLLNSCASCLGPSQGARILMIHAQSRIPGQESPPQRGQPWWKRCERLADASASSIKQISKCSSQLMWSTLTQDWHPLLKKWSQVAKNIFKLWFGFMCSLVHQNVQGVTSCQKYEGNPRMRLTQEIQLNIVPTSFWLSLAVLGLNQKQRCACHSPWNLSLHMVSTNQGVNIRRLTCPWGKLWGWIFLWRRHHDDGLLHHSFVEPEVWRGQLQRTYPNCHASHVITTRYN